MKEIICYKISDGRIFEDKEIAEQEQININNKKILDHTQNVPLNFQIGDIVYICARNKVRQCRVEEINTEQAYYEDDLDEKYTQIFLIDINDKEEGYFSFHTSYYRRDLNNEIVKDFKELCTFNF